MTTLPQNGPISPDPELAPHRARAVAESFGVDPARYDRARPRYPSELIERIVAELPPGARVLDVGCGTGIEARQLAEAGCIVLGVDPDERMAAFARQTGVDVEVSTFEDWDACDREFDAVVAGQSWHWVEPLAGAEKAADVLRSGGRITMFAHVFQAPDEIGVATLAAISRTAAESGITLPEPRGASTPMHELYEAMFTRFDTGIRDTKQFSEPERWRFEWESTYTRDQWLDLLPTTGILTRLPPERLTPVLDAVGRTIDHLGGSFTLPNLTLASTAQRVT